jgi:LmbE family N-acetylglucosaminyl deacetylase
MLFSSSPQRVLVIAPHPDDEILGCGGSIARHIAHGDTVHVLIATRGSSALYSDEAVENVRKEAKEAHALLGVAETIFFDFPAPCLDTIPQHQISDAISKVVRSFQPQIVYIPHIGDLHHDHGAIYHAGLVACRPTRQGSVRFLLCYETLSETDWAPPSSSHVFIPTLFVDITSFLEQKIDAMRCFKSQLFPSPHSRSLDSINHLAKLRGATIGREAAEAFMLVRAIS